MVAFRRLSPVLVSLLGAGGDEVPTMWDAHIDDFAAGAVSWAGSTRRGLDGPRPGHDRVLIHEQQLREAVGRPHREA